MPHSLLALVALTGCEEGSALPTETFTDIVVTPGTWVSAIQHVTFVTSSAEDGWVAFGPVGEAGWRAPAVPLGDGAWEATLLGLPAGADAWIQVGAGDDAGPTTAVTTGPPPDWLDHYEGSVGTPSPGFLVMSVMTEDGVGAVILDTRGRPVWWYAAPPELHSRNYNRARLSRDLDEIWFNAMGPTGSGEDDLVRVPIDGSAHEIVSRPFTHHDFWLHEDGTLALIENDAQEVEGKTVYGDRLVEYAPTGATREVWSAWDVLSYDPGTSPIVGESWTIANHVEYVAASDTYVVSLRNVSTLVAFGRETGDLDWTLGPGGTHEAEDAHRYQHGFDVLSDGVLMFDNGAPGLLSSRAVRYRFDGASAANVWEYRPDPALYSFIMGDAHLLDNGHTRVTFSTEGTVHEVDPDGVVVSEFTYESGTVLGFPEPWDSLVGP